MKRISLLIAILTLSLGAFSQNEDGKIKKANKAFEGFSYSQAIDHYENADSEYLDHLSNTAMSYWKLNQIDEAEELFAEIAHSDGRNANDIYNYAAVLRENKKYKESDKWMQKYYEMNPNDSRGKLHATNAGIHEKLLVDNGQFKIKNLEANSEQSDFGTSFYKTQVIFASSREGVKTIRRKWNWNQLPFLDVYVADKDSNGSDLVNINRFHKSLNKKYHEGPVAFNQAGDLMIFTTNNYTQKSSEGMTRLKLKSSQLINGEWSLPADLPFNGNNHSTGHATISGDGKWLYFSSDMPGGKGGVDIYKAKINEDGSYGEPLNLGININTEGNEMFPFIHPNNELLFFASDGRAGLGGLDIFVAEIKSTGQLGKVVNIGAPINSNRDDFALILDNEGKTGYFSSDREGGQGSDDIYGFDALRPVTFLKTIIGVCKDKDENILANITIELLNTNGEVIKTMQSSDKGEYNFMVEENKTFMIRGAQEKYLDGVNSVSTKTDKDILVANIELEKDSGLLLYALITDSKTGDPIDSAHLKITDNITGKTIEFWTPSTGDYSKPLAEKKLMDKGSYNITIDRMGYLGKKVSYTTLFDKEGIYKVNGSVDLSLEPISIGGDLSKIIDINPIYFDLGKSIIRPDAALELDKIVKVMNENPKMVIELGSHTDSRGSDKSNESLSDLRAKASAAYIAQKITTPKRIFGKGFGENKPNTLTLENGNPQILTEEYINAFKTKDKEQFDLLHQMNRRTEFIIIKM